MRRRILTASLLAAAALAAGCGQESVDLPSGEQDAAIKEGATVFYQRCGGCHTLDVAGQQGSATNVNSREYKDGPNFNQRLETRDQVLYALHNGGFSSGPMPQNIVVGKQADAVAKFVAKYSGSQVSRAPQVGQSDNPQGQAGGENPVPIGGAGGG